MLIGEVAQHAGISARMLRHYDRVGLVSPSVRTSGGYREYSDDDLLRLFHVEGLRSLGLSLTQVAAAIDDRAFEPASMVTDLIAQSREQIARSQDLVRRLEEVQATSPRTWSDVLRTIALIRGLDASDASARHVAALRTTDAGVQDLPVLVEAMLAEPSEDAAGALQWSIARIGDPAVPALAAALHDADGDRRRRAFDALVKIGSDAARRVIGDASSHRDPRVRRRAVLAGAREHGGRAIPALVGLVASGEDDVAAADTLAEIASELGSADTVVAQLAAALASSDAAARRRLTAALHALPIAATRSTLTSLLDDDDRATALTAKMILDAAGRDDPER